MATSGGSRSMKAWQKCARSTLPRRSCLSECLYSIIPWQCDILMKSLQHFQPQVQRYQEVWWSVWLWEKGCCSNITSTLASGPSSSCKEGWDSCSGVKWWQEEQKEGSTRCLSIWWWTKLYMCLLLALQSIIMSDKFELFLWLSNRQPRNPSWNYIVGQLLCLKVPLTSAVR